METTNIPEDRWVQFCDQFNREHAGWPATIRLMDPKIGPQALAEDLAFVGMSFDTKGTRPSSLEISVGDGPDAQVRHVIDLPLRIREALSPNGDVDVLIEPADGAAALMHLRAPTQ